MIIDDVCQVIGRETVRFLQNLVVNLIIANFNFTSEFVRKLSDSVCGHGKTHNERHSISLFRSDFRWAQGPAMAIIPRFDSRSFLILPHFRQTISGTKARVSRALFHKDISVFLVDFRPFTLAIGTIITTNVGTLIPGQAQPLQTIYNHLLRRSSTAGTVRVFDA
jgi:hypothetical protein